jgi:hypothetical protein
VGADVVDGALVAVIARVALIDVVLSAFACSAVIIIIIILKERNAGHTLGTQSPQLSVR